MVEIKDILERFAGIILSEENKKESIRRAVSEVINADIKPEQVKIKNNVIYLDIRPIYKNEILIKRDLILRKLRESFLGKKAPEEIR